MKTKVGGYFIAHGAIVSMHQIVSVEDGNLPENFMASENLDDKVLHISEDGKRIEVVKQHAPTADKQLAQKRRRVRAKRNALIAETDYLMQPDYPITAELLEQVKAYRRQLRDLTEQPSFAETGEVVFPQKTW